MTDKKPHPAKFHDRIVDTAANILEDQGVQPGHRLLDPFAGTGKVFGLLDALPLLFITALELEPEWAAWDDRVTVGNALDNGFPDESFDIIFTSPTYGNRMADSFNASQPRRRNTYTHKMGRKLHPDNSGTLQWGPKYRTFHWDAWRETVRVLKTGGLFLLNVKNHIRGGELQKVAEWHRDVLTGKFGMELVETAKIPTPGNRQGENHSVRVDHEVIYVFMKT